LIELVNIINADGKNMDKEELLNYWKNTSDKDYIAMNNLFRSKDYSWSLFIGHLVIEKLL
jgi:hypothetical protein